jgi:uncharacterized metal-binding protein YceD (DUF177 family)
MTTMTKRERLSERPWSAPVAVHEVSETGRHVELIADERTRAAIAKLAGLRSLPRLAAEFDVTRRGRDSLRVAGHVSATVGQTCVVTLEPIENEVDEDIDLLFAPTAALAPADHGGAGVPIDARDGPEPLTGGMVDLGALATEFLILGVDPYPRKPGAVLEVSSAGDDSVKPFAVLAALKKGQGGSAG